MEAIIPILIFYLYNKDKFKENIDIDIDLDKIIENIPEVHKYNKKIMNIDTKAEFNDMEREMKGLCTDIVVNDFFSSEDTLFNFLSTVYTLYEKSIEQYVKINKLNPTDIFFTFKGGNILRIISNEFLLELPEMASQIIKEFYNKFFKRSDADFSIYINPKLKNYDIIYDDICNIAYFLQVHIRNIFQENLTKYFNFFRYNNQYKKNILEKNLINFNGANSLKDPDNSVYYNGNFTDFIFQDESVNNNTYNTVNDKYIEFGDSESEINIYELKDNDSFMFISFNKALEFKSGDGGITKFALIRTKINFNAMLQTKNKEEHKNVGGELIDVSVPHRKDVSIQEVFDNIGKAISRYTINHESEHLNFNSYSLLFLIEDLEKILFHVAEYPWDDNKYAKRLNRLCYLYYLDMFIQITDYATDPNKITSDSCPARPMGNKERLSELLKIKKSINNFSPNQSGGATNVIEIETEDKFNNILAENSTNNKYLLIKFGPSWCNNCRTIEPKFNEFTNTYTNIIFVKLNDDANDEIAHKYKIRSFPTFLVLKNGTQIDKLEGANRDKLEELCKKYNSSSVPIPSLSQITSTPSVLEKNITTKPNNSSVQVHDNHPPENSIHFNRIEWYYKYIYQKVINKNKYNTSSTSINIDTQEYQVTEKNKSSDITYSENMDDFKEAINVNFDVLEESFKNIDKYCDNGPGNLNKNNIYEGSMLSLK